MPSRRGLTHARLNQRLHSSRDVRLELVALAVGQLEEAEDSTVLATHLSGVHIGSRGGEGGRQLVEQTA